MSIAELKKVIVPPAAPVEAGPVDRWAVIEEQLNLKLPDDYKEFGLTYGTGRFCNGFLEIYNPFSESFGPIVDYQIRFLNGVVAAGMETPYEIYPAKTGLFPLGRDENGNILCWLTNGLSEKWPIVLRSHENTYETHQLTLTSFLAKAFDNSTRPSIWPDPFRESELIFELAKQKKSSKPKKKRK